MSIFHRTLLFSRKPLCYKYKTISEAQYSQLCALCQHPDKCDYPDDYSGYEGALKCLAHNGGQVAFTKVFYVHKFFGVSFILLFVWNNRSILILILYLLRFNRKIIFKYPISYVSNQTIITYIDFFDIDSLMIFYFCNAVHSIRMTCTKLLLYRNLFLLNLWELFKS